MRIIPIYWLIAFVALAIGCSPGTQPASTPAPSASEGVLDEARVLAIAREAIATNDTWLDQAEFETPKQKPDGSWSVTVWRLPKVPGGHRFILIDEKGRVTTYGRGA